MKHLYISVALLYALTSALIGQAGSNNAVINDNIFLQGQYVEVGISECGVFGTTESQPAGYHGNVGNYLGFVADPAQDGWSSGSPAYNGDYFLPGSPEEGWGIELGGVNYGNFSQCGVYQVPMSSVSTWMENTKHYAEWNGSVAGIDIRQEVSFEDNETYFFIKAELTNTTASEIYDTYYMRNVDPDNERMWPGGSYTTINSIIYQPDSDPCDRALVSATGMTYGMYLGLAAVDPRARVTHGGFSNRDASNIYDGSGFNQSGSATADAAISISFKIDTIGPGETATVYYAYILDQSQVSAAIGNLTRLLANGTDITNTLVHSTCEEPVELEIINAESFSWVWSPTTYLSSNTGTTVICTAPPGTYSYSAVGSNACGSTITYNFDLEIAADNDPPVVTCSPDITVGECDNNLTIVAPVATDNCNIQSLTHDSPYGVSSTDASGTYPVGVHSIRWTAEDYAGNSAFCLQQVEVVANPAAPASSDESYTYGENAILTAAPAANHSIQWYVNADLSDVPVVSSALNLGILDAGSYTRYATQVSDITGCESPATTVQLTINTAPLEVSADDVNKVYGTADPALTWQISSGALVGSDALSGALSRVAGNDAGDYAIEQGTLDAGSNYTLTFVGATLTINTAALEIRADDQNIIYGTADPVLTWQITSGALVGSDALSGALSRVAGNDVGDYAIEQGTLDAGSNYTLTFIDGTLTIATAALELTANDLSKTYGEADPVLSYTITGGALVGGDLIAGSPAREAGEDVGIYAIEQGTLDAGSNYAMTYIDGTLTIATAALEVTADDLSKTYGEADPALSYTITGGALVGTDLITGSMTRAAGEDAGGYAITQGTLTAGSNYVLTFVDGTLTINSLALEVTADDLSKTYGEADPSLSYAITGGALVGGDLISGAPTRDAGEDVGGYAITQGTLTAGGNYDLTFVDASLTINAAALEVTADDQSKTYGEADPSLSYAITGGALVGGDLISGAPTRDAGEDVGVYTIGQGTLSAGSNYALTFVEASLTINAAALEMTADDLSKTYGDADPTLSYSITAGALAGGDLITGALARDAGEDVGVYTIGQGTLSAGSNYTLSFVEGTLTIAVAALEVTADDLSKTYGEADPVLSYTITGGALVGGDLIAGSPAREAGEDVGIYAIEQGTLDAGSNYALTYVDGTLTISTAALEVTADDLTKEYGSPNPPLTYTITGGALVGGDLLTGELSRVAGEAVASYAIGQGTLAAGSNYVLTFVDGLFTVDKATLRVTATDQTKYYGEPNPTLSYVYSGFVNGDVASVLDAEPVLSTTADQLSAAGTYPIVLSGGTDDNYDFELVDGSLTVQKVMLTLTANDASREYGEANPIFSFVLTGFINNESILVIDTEPVGNTVAGPASTAGSYDIVFSGGDDNNYDFSYVNGTLTIVKAPLTIVVENQEIGYGDDLPDLSYTVEGMKNGEQEDVFTSPVSITSEYTPFDDVGEYALAGSGAVAVNYTFVYMDGVLTVSKAEQEIAFVAIPEGLRMTQRHQLEATSTSGLTVSFASLDTDVASVDGDMLSILTKGTATIRAYQDGDQNWLPAEALQEIGTLPSFDNVKSLFTPNGDGINDFWYIPDLEEMGIVNVQVFNRYGQLVYEAEHYANDWNGQWKNRDLPEGAYYYILDTELNGMQKGVVNIVR